MATAADRIKANAERLRQKPSGQAPATEKPPAATAAPLAQSPGGGAAVRQKNVRRTVDLAPAAHRALDGWQSAVADRLGLARVTGQEVLAALVDRLLTDDELGDQITQAIAANRT